MIIGQQQSEFCAVLRGNLPVIYPTAKQMFLLMTWAKRHQILYKSVIISVSSVGLSLEKNSFSKVSTKHM